MRERDIETRVAVINSAMQSDADFSTLPLSGRLALIAGLELLGSLLVDINRIADALEAVALKGDSNGQS